MTEELATALVSGPRTKQGVSCVSPLTEGDLARDRGSSAAELPTGGCGLLLQKTYKKKKKKKKRSSTDMPTGQFDGGSSSFDVLSSQVYLLLCQVAKTISLVYKRPCLKTRQI